MPDPAIHELFMRRAIELARQGIDSRAGGPFGCVIVRDGQIVGEGFNRVLADNDPTAHGEIVALRDAGRRLETYRLTDCDLYTTGQPCPMCLSAIYWARIERVFYGFTVADVASVGFDDRRIAEELVKPSHDRSIPQQQLLADEARAVLKDYGGDSQRTAY